MITAKLALGDLGILEDQKAPAVPTFEEIAKRWERVTAQSWKTGTRITYGNALRARLLPVFKKLPIDQVTPDRVEAWWTAAREEGLSGIHLANLRALMRGICRRAVSQGILKVNPVERIEGRLGREDSEIRQVEYLTAEDLTTFLTKAAELYREECPIFMAMATAGLRIGEAVAL